MNTNDLNKFLTGENRPVIEFGVTRETVIYYILAAIAVSFISALFTALMTRIFAK